MCIKCILSMFYICCIYVYSANIATLSCSRSKRNVVQAEGAAAAAGRAGRQVGRACGPVRAAPWGCHTRANPHELVSN